MAISGNFNPATGVLAAIGDNGKNTITFSRDAAGSLFVNGGTVAIAGGKATVTNTTRIQAFGQGGDDTISLDETNGALPGADLFGGARNDTITGASGNDELFGQDGNDTLLGKGGDDLLFGGAGNDVMDGGVGNDQLFGQAGNDLMIWNPGGGNDLFEGGDGTDTAEVNGGNGAEVFTISANGARVLFARTSPAPFTIDIGTTENLVLNANGGDDTITAGNGLAGLIQLTIDGGAGNDTITGGDGNDTLLGGDGNDLITGGRGNDTAQLGNGDDTFVWNPGDGSDTVDGQAGTDTLLFNGANVNEKIDISANGSHVRFTRDVANITMDLKGIENIQFTAKGGADQITVNNLAGTDTKQVTVDLAGQSGTGVGDGSADIVTVVGTGGSDAINILGSGNSVTVTGLAAQVTLNGTEGTNDTLVIQALGGNDTINASTLPADVIKLSIDGGDGNDTITGSGGADQLFGGIGNDVIIGGRGDDAAFLGDGNDQFIWNPGDGSDTVEGQAGTDKLIFNGANVNEKIDISANGSRVRFTRDVANITMDLNGVETIQFNALGGADTINVNDLTGTDVKLVAIDLAGSVGAATGDGAADNVIVNGTAGDDIISIARTNGVVTVNGLAAQVSIAHAEGANDTLTVNGLAGNDTIDASALTGGQINLVINGGDGNDTIKGSAGNDTVIGGRGTDVAQLGSGDDVFVWNPGDGSDTVDGQAGTDTLLFNGANVNENITISANGTHATLFRDVANITMDLNSVEHIQLNALGGTDTITVNDLTGTGVNQVAIDLGAQPGSPGGDGAQDTVVVNGTGGDDVINASQLGTAMQFIADGGAGDDILLGSAGNDTLSGGAGDDILIGGGGQDVLDGGTGNNILLQSAIAKPPVGGALASNADLTPQSLVNGTAGNDHIEVGLANGALNVTGLKAPVTIGNADAAHPIVVAGLAGDDVISAAGITSATMQFILDGGAGNDVLHGGQGNDLLVGGAGADRFAFSGQNGTDTIADFQGGLDKILITGYGSALDSFSDLRGQITQVGADVHVDLGAKVAGAGSIVLQNTQLAAISASDFAFS